MERLKAEAAARFGACTQNPGDGPVLFSYTDGARETWSAAAQRIPISRGLWLAGAECPELVSDLFISHSAAEIICFASLRPYLLRAYPEQRAYAATGLLPSRGHAEELRALFPLARWHILFGADLPGRVADARMAAWRKGQDARFRLVSGRLWAAYRESRFSFDPDSFSMSRFEKATGLRSGIRTHQPPHGFASFFSLFHSLSDDP